MTKVETLNKPGKKENFLTLIKAIYKITGANVTQYKY